MEISDALTPPKGPRVFEKQKRDVARESLNVARDVGTVRLHHSRLNVFTSLSKGDKEDNFKFRAASRGPLRLGTWSDGKGLHIQILNRAGRVIADSEEGTGRRYEKFERLVSGKGEIFEAGEYYVRVSRPAKDDMRTEVPYSLQLQMGSEVKRDYDTTEYAAPEPQPGDALANATPTPATLGAQGAATLLSEGLTNLVSILNPVKDLFFGSGSFGNRRL